MTVAADISSVTRGERGWSPLAAAGAGREFSETRPRERGTGRGFISLELPLGFPSPIPLSPVTDEVELALREAQSEPGPVQHQARCRPGAHCVRPTWPWAEGPEQERTPRAPSAPGEGTPCWGIMCPVSTCTQWPHPF